MKIIEKLALLFNFKYSVTNTVIMRAVSILYIKLYFHLVRKFNIPVLLIDSFCRVI